MKRIIAVTAACALLMGTTHRSQAVELLISGGFETPGGAAGEVPLWTLTETVTNSAASVNSAELSGPPEDVQLWLRAFAGGQGLGAGQGNFDGDNDVDGRDFLTWQRNPAVGNLADWQANYGTTGGGATLINASLFQKKPAVPGDTYTFRGESTFEEFYSGFVTTLGDLSPLGEVASPTVTQFKMEFLNAQGNVVGTPTTLDLRTEQTFPDFPVAHSPLVAVAPATATEVRVVAEAKDMVWNGSSSQAEPGVLQSAFFNNFSLMRSGAPGMELLDNADLDLGTPSALDFWDRAINPTTGCCGITETIPFGQLLRTAGFANRAGNGGSLGVWISPFFGGWEDPANPGFPRMGGSADPVDASMSQTVAAVPGGVYNFSGWMKFEQNYSGGVDVISTNEPSNTLFDGQTSPTQSLITLEFLDSEGNVIQSSVIDVKEERQALASCGGNANSQTCGPAGNGWTQHSFTNVVAPANAAEVRLRAEMIDGVYNDDPQQSAFWDDFSLDGPAPPGLANISVPEPSSLVILGLGAVLMGLGRGRK